MPEDHNTADCEMCRFLAKPCAKCGKMHAYYEEAAECMQTDFSAANQYTQAMCNKESN